MEARAERAAGTMNRMLAVRRFAAEDAPAALAGWQPGGHLRSRHPPDPVTSAPAVSPPRRCGKLKS
jgi:hypothetical protein